MNRKIRNQRMFPQFSECLRCWEYQHFCCDVVTLRQQLNIVKYIVQQLRISATIYAPISALHDVISYRQTGQIQR